MDSRFHPLRTWRGRDANRRRLGGVPSRLRQETAKGLEESHRVGHHARQILGPVNDQGALAYAIDDGVPSLVHKTGHVRRLGRDQQRAALDPPLGQRVGDHAERPVGLLVDDPEEPQHLDRVRGARQGGDGRSSDGSQRRAQLVADHAR